MEAFFKLQTHLCHTIEIKLEYIGFKTISIYILLSFLLLKVMKIYSTTANTRICLLPP